MNRIDGARGLTLIEIMLVLAVATTIIIMGIRQYQLWQTERDYLVLRYNVDILFQGMKQYYQANCDDQTNEFGVVKAGELSPSKIPDPPIPVKMDIADVQLTQSDWPRSSSIVDNSTDTGFYAQFNPKTGTEKNAYACSYFGTGSPVCTDPNFIIEGSNILLWQAQVVVKMRDPTKTVAYMTVADADCVVDTFTEGDAINCSTGITTPGTSASYLVWQRLPSFSAPNIRSSSWLSAPLEKILKLQYTHDPMYEMYNPGQAKYKNYLCGG